MIYYALSTTTCSSTVGGPAPILPATFLVDGNVTHYVEAGAAPAGSIAGVILPSAMKTDNLHGHSVRPPTTSKASRVLQHD